MCCLTRHVRTRNFNVDEPRNEIKAGAAHWATQLNWADYIKADSDVKQRFM